jgi:4'-phosphopantetheinyl transferase
MQTINWLVQSTADCPALMASDGEGILSAGERERLAALTNEKRRGDWLLGRWTAKRLLQALIEQGRGVLVPLDQVVIEADETGAPHGLVDGFDAPVPLSISHSSGTALCATTLSLSRAEGDNGTGARLGQAVGADIERIELRAREFVDDYFTPDEIIQVRNAPPAWYDTLVTAIWSAKEAALKAFHLGLTVDARSVSCHLYPPKADGGWARAEMHCAPCLPARDLSGWWCVAGDYVLTIAVMNGGEPRM